MALAALQANPVIDKFDRRLAIGAGEDLEELWINPHDVVSLKTVGPTIPNRRCLRSVRQCLVVGTILWNNRWNVRNWAPCVLLIIWCVAFPSASTAARSEDLDTKAKAEAYRFFLVGRYLEGEGDLDGAIRSYRDAAELDVVSAEILGELASLYARRNKGEEALATAREALVREPVNLTAHRVIGLIFADRAQGRNGTPDDTATAIKHLDQARDTILPDFQVELTLARLYLFTGASNDAIRLLEELLEDEVGFSEAAILLAQAYEKTGRIAKALATLEGVVRDGRPSSRALRRLGGLYERGERWSEAAEIYKRSILQNPRSIGTRRRLANALIKDGQTELAREVLRELVTIRPKDAASLYLLTQVELDINNFEEAETVARRLIEVEPNDIRGAYALSRVFGRRREYQQVIEVLEPALKSARQGNISTAQVASLLERLGFAYEQLSDYEKAAEIYQEATELAPDDLTFEVRLAQAYLQSGQVLNAIEVIERAQTRHPNDVMLAWLQAETLGVGGDVQAGMDVLHEALMANNSEPMAYLALADYYNEHDRFREAVELLQSAEIRFPTDTSIIFQLGAVLEQNDRHVDAERAFRRILDRNPEHAAALNYLGYMLADRGERLEESVDLLERATELDPHNGAYLDSLGWAYFKMNRFALAETHLRQASEQMTQNSVVQDHLGDLMFRLGRYTEAVSAWERALAGDREEIEPAAIERKIGAARQRLR